MQYVPAGSFRGDLMYANDSKAMIWIIDIDPATGLAIDAGTGLPTLGTTNPSQTRFATDFTHAWNLEFDVHSHDLFVSDYADSKTISQIGGFPGRRVVVTQ
ncbi:MAG: hypothetical protein FJ148_12755 [Deltaproteobacteria bacterium]|nr:hypothetical protein [Deltaproteobacteria bacterium]